MVCGLFENNQCPSLANTVGADSIRRRRYLRVIRSQNPLSGSFRQAGNGFGVRIARMVCGLFENNQCPLSQTQLERIALDADTISAQSALRIRCQGGFGVRIARMVCGLFENNQCPLSQTQLERIALDADTISAQSALRIRCQGGFGVRIARMVCGLFENNQCPLSQTQLERIALDADTISA